MSAIKLSIILASVLSWTDIMGFLSIMLHDVSIYVNLYKNFCST
jgi:hypothetical protein